MLFADRGGNRFTTPNMIVDLEAGTLTGRGGVTGAGPLGVLQADTYELRARAGATCWASGKASAAAGMARGPGD